MNPVAGGMSRAGDSVILEEQLDENYEPSNEEILEYAKWLGMDVQREPDLVWIAREGLKAPLPEHWKPCRMPDNDIYYFNFQSGESTWDHPCDDYYRKLYAEEKKKHDWHVQRGLAAAASPPQGRGQGVDPSRKRLPALSPPDYAGQMDASSRAFESQNRPPEARWSGDMRTAPGQQDANSQLAMRPGASEGPGGSQTRPRAATSAPSVNTQTPKYDLYGHWQGGADRAASTPPTFTKGAEDWDRDRRPPPLHPGNQHSPPLAQRSSVSTPRVSSSTPSSQNRSGGKQWAQPPSPHSSGSMGQTPLHSANAASTPLRNGGVVADWSDSDTSDEEEHSGKGGAFGQPEQKRQSSKSPASANTDEHIVKAQEAAYRREFMARQRHEREEWEADVRQKERVSRDEWETDMMKDTDKWKMRRRDEIFQERQLLEDEYNEQIARLKDKEDTTISQMAAASQGRLAVIEERHLAGLDALKQEREQLLQRAVTENRQLREASESSKSLPGSVAEAESLLREAEAEAAERKAVLLEEARHSVEEAKRAMMQQARSEVEGEKQRMLQMLRKELEQRQAEMESQSPRYSPTEDRPADPSEKVVRWKAIMQEEQMSAHQREALGQKVSQVVAGEEARMLEAERRRVQARIEARLGAEEQRLVQERLHAIEAQLREDQETVYERRRQELEEQIRERMHAEEEAAVQRKRAELEANLARVFEKEKGDREISLRFELEKEMQNRRKELKAEIEGKLRDDSSSTGSPSGFMANLLPGQQLTEAQLVDQERAQMLERVRALVAKEEEQLLKDQREAVTEKVKRALSDEGGEKGGAVVEDKRMSEGENKPQEEFTLDRSLSMEGLQEGFGEGLERGEEIARAEEEGRVRLARVKEEVEEQVRKAREEALAEWEAKTRGELEAEKERRVAQMRGEVEMLVKSERLKLAKQREKDVAEAKRKAEEDRLSAEASPTPDSVLPGPSSEWRASEAEMRAQNERALSDLRGSLQQEHARALEQLEAGHKSALAKTEAELGALREELEAGRKEKLERERSEELGGERREGERAAAEKEGQEALEAVRKRFEEQVAELNRTSEEKLELVRTKVESERVEEEQRQREAMELEVAEKVRKDKRRMLEDEKKKDAELKKEMKARQEFQRAKMEAELEREIRREREKRREALSKELNAEEDLRKRQAEEEWRSKAAKLEKDAAAEMKKVKDARWREMKEDQEWLEKEAEAELDRAREEIGRAKDLRLERLKRETQEDIEREEERAEERKAERSKQIELTLKELERDGSHVIEEARRKAAEVRAQVAADESENEARRVFPREARGNGVTVAVPRKVWADENGLRAVPGALEVERKSEPLVLSGEAAARNDERVGGLKRAGVEGGEEGQSLEQVRQNAESERSKILLQFQLDARAKQTQVLRHAARSVVESKTRLKDGGMGRGSSNGSASVQGESANSQGSALSLQARSEGGSPLRPGRFEGGLLGERPGEEWSPRTPAPFGGKRWQSVNTGSGSLEPSMSDWEESRGGQSAPSRIERGAERQQQELRLSTEELMEELRKQKSTSPERMDRQGLEPSGGNDSGNDCAIEQGVGTRVVGNGGDGWSQMLDAQNEREGNVETRLWRLRTREPVTSKVPAMKLALEGVPTLAEAAKLVRDVPGSGFAIAASASCDELPPKGGPSVVLETAIPVVPHLTKTAAVEGSSPTARAFVPLQDTNSPLGPPLTHIPLSKLGSDELNPLKLNLPPAIQATQAEPGPPPLLKGGYFQGNSDPLETGSLVEEPETPRDDFDDMESLASTVASARASVFDGGRRVWEEQFGGAESRGPIRANSLPVQPLEAGPPAPTGALALAEKARMFLLHQRKFLKERQMIIEQARADWKKRLQELDQVAGIQERQRKRGFLMQLKVTLEDAAHRVNQEARQMRTLKHELLEEAVPPTPSIPVFRTTLPARKVGPGARWSSTDELQRPRTADAAERKRTSWTGPSGGPSEAVRSSLRSAVARDPLPSKVMGQLVRWNNERQIAGDLTQEHTLWMAAFQERLHMAGAVLNQKAPTKR